MFVCVSANPAIDKRVLVASLKPGEIVRARTVESHAGGKSTHVAMVLRTLGETPQWAGLCGGPSGATLMTGLSRLGIKAYRYATEAETRTNLEIIDHDGTVTEVLEPGSRPTDNELAAFENLCKELLLRSEERNVVIFSGSLPPGAPADLYARLIVDAHGRQWQSFVDASGEALKSALRARPDFVKPNRQEAEEVLDIAISTPAEAVRAVRGFIALGARAAALSLGGEGLLYCPGPNGPVLHAVAPKQQVRSTVGCGDSAMAGFASAIARGVPPAETLRLAAACGAANCLADAPGAARAEDIQKLEKEIRIQTLSPAL